MDTAARDLGSAVRAAPPAPRSPRGERRREHLARVLVHVARRVGRTLDLDGTLREITRAVVDLLGFQVAVLNLVTPEGDLEVVTVAGPEEVRRALLGSRQPLDAWLGVLDDAQPLGALRFVDSTVPVPEDMAVWVPHLAVLEHRDAWQPEDALLAPLHAGDGSLLGVLSVDLPSDGMRPDAAQRELLELFAVQAGLALEHARLHADLQRSQAVFERTFEHSPVGMAVFDADRRFVRINPAYCALLGRTPEEVLGRRAADFSHPDDRDLTAGTGGRARDGSAAVRGVEKRYVQPDGTVVWGRVTLTVLDGGGVVLAHVEDVTAARAAVAELERRASSDPLTGLANRERFASELEERLRAAPAGRTAVLFCDVDRFKVVNDTLGHAAGDDLLREVARTITGVLRNGDVAARLGGDEFVVLLGDVEGPEQARAVAERVRTASRRVVRLDGREVRTSVTVGVALDGPGSTARSLLAAADAALYRAKSAGRDRVELAGPDV